MDYSIQPIGISGVYINGDFHETSSSGTYAHYIDYVNGKIVFANPVDTSDEVRMEYSYKYVNFETSQSDWFKQVMFDSFKPDDSFLISASGAWSILSETRTQLPTVVVQVTPRKTFQGMQIGGGQRIRQEVVFNIYCENTWDRNTLLDIITYQNQKTIFSFDKNLIAEQNKMTFNDNGSLSDNAMNYPEMVAPTGDGGFFWKRISFDNMTGQDISSNPPLFRATVKTTCEIEFPEL